MTAHTNWTFIETVTSTTQTWNVWKNHGTGVTDNNSLGSDFYIALFINTAQPLILKFYAFEDWNTSTKQSARPVCGSGSSVIGSNAAMTTSAPYTLSTSSVYG